MYVLCKLLFLLFQNKTDSGKTLKNPNTEWLLEALTGEEGCDFA